MKNQNIQVFLHILKNLEITKNSNLTILTMCARSLVLWMSLSWIFIVLMGYDKQSKKLKGDKMKYKGISIYT